MDIREHIEKLIAEAGGVTQLAEKYDLPRQTIYNLRRGGWPSAKIASTLGFSITFDRNAPPKRGIL